MFSSSLCVHVNKSKAHLSDDGGESNDLKYFGSSPSIAIYHVEHRTHTFRTWKLESTKNSASADKVEKMSLESYDCDGRGIETATRQVLISCELFSQNLSMFFSQTLLYFFISLTAHTSEFAAAN